MPSKRPRVEEFQVSGQQLVSSVKELFHEGKIRRVSIRNAAGVTLIEIPLVVGLAGAALAPVWAAVAAVAALVAKCTLVVERVEDTDAKPRPRSSKGRKSAA